MNAIVILAMTMLLAASPHRVAANGAESPCAESDAVEIAGAISIKQILGLIRKDGTPQFTLHFDIPTMLEGAPLEDVFLSIMGPDEAMEFTTPLKAWVVEDGLEGMLIATEPRIREYTIWATYTPRDRDDGCGFVTRLKLAGDPVIDDRLACLQGMPAIECNYPELSTSARLQE